MDAVPVTKTTKRKRSVINQQLLRAQLKNGVNNSSSDIQLQISRNYSFFFFFSYLRHEP